MITQRGDWRES